jgi:phosphoglycerate dehydrogenase-like enzyme
VSTTVWLPEDDWSDQLSLPASLDVTVWRSGMPLPQNASDVEFYVPEYLGPSEVHEVIPRLPSLKVVQTLTAGYEHIQHLVPAGVTLCNARGVHEASTAELAVGLVLAALRGLPGFVRAQDQGVWIHSRHDALADKRVLVVGAGAVGTAVAERLAPFEVAVTRVSRHERDGVVGAEELPSLLPQADVVILTVPLTADTRGMVDAEFLGKLADGALLVNVSRGAVVDTEALVTALRSGRIRAALDVTDPEPLPPGHALWHAPNVVISPHVGGDTSAFLPRAWRLLQEQLDRFAAGEPLLNVVTTEPL